jgi:predicted acyl esterase
VVEESTMDQSLGSTTPDRTTLDRILNDRMVKMRDGISLATDIYLPKAERPVPTILVRLCCGSVK